MDNSSPVVPQNYASLYLRICAKDSFKLSNMIGHSKQIKFMYLKFPKKCTFGSESFDFLQSAVPLVYFCGMCRTTQNLQRFCEFIKPLFWP